MKTIELTKNKFALVNDKDYEFLNQFKWYCAHNIVIHIRLFIDIKKAATAYNKAAIKYFGKFAVLNNI